MVLKQDKFESGDSPTLNVSLTCNFNFDKVWMVLGSLGIVMVGQTAQIHHAIRVRVRRLYWIIDNA